MPIHDQGYRRFTGLRPGRGAAWLVITRTAVRGMLRRRTFAALLVLAWVPFGFRAIQIYASAAIPQLEAFGPSVATFRDFLNQQNVFVFFVTIYAGAGLIANDRRANALQIYLSKPLTRLEYVAGKAAALLAFLLLVTWVPAVLLLALQIALAGSFSFARAHLFLLPAVTVYAFLQVTLATLAMLALSSLSKSSRFVGVMYAGVILFTQAIQGVLWLITRAPATSLISPTASLGQLGDLIFRLPPGYELPGVWSLAVVGLIMAGSVLILERRVRGVEVVT